MRLSQRLQAVITEIEGTVLADIGTDHGYIAIEAVRKSRVERAVACDINSGPLSRAKANINSLQLASKIDTRLGYGLSAIKADEVDCICIAGMGGLLIIEILHTGRDVLHSAERLILQPQSDVPMVRRFIHELGFKISNEQMLLEGKYYTIITCKPGIEENYSPAGYAFGRLLIDNHSNVLQSYIQERLLVCEKILQKHDVPDIRNELELCKEVLTCY